MIYFLFLVGDPVGAQLSLGRWNNAFWEGGEAPPPPQKRKSAPANPQIDLGSMRPSLAHASKRRRTVAVDLGATPGRRADSGPRPRSRRPRPGSRRRRPGSRAGSTQVRVTRTWVEPASASGRPSLDPGRDFNSRGPPLIYVCMYGRK